jgi:hypothetical protein
MHVQMAYDDVYIVSTSRRQEPWAYGLQVWLIKPILAKRFTGRTGALRTGSAARRGRGAERAPMMAATVLLAFWRRPGPPKAPPPNAALK